MLRLIHSPVLSKRKYTFVTQRSSLGFFFVSFAECLTSCWCYDRSKQNKHHKKLPDLSCRILYVTIIRTTRGIPAPEPDWEIYTESRGPPFCNIVEGDLHGMLCHWLISVSRRFEKNVEGGLWYVSFGDILMHPQNYIPIWHGHVHF